MSNIKTFLDVCGREPCQFIEDLFNEGFDYVCLGDNHDVVELSSFVVSLLPSLKKQNKVIYSRLGLIPRSLLRLFFIFSKTI